MIHPINIPDDLLAANPKRPQFIEPKPRLRITYGEDGRRFNQQGQPISPHTPCGQWNDFFLRSFIRRITCETDNTKSEDDRPELIDIVDLQPTSLMSHSEHSDEEDGSVETTSVTPSGITFKLDNLKKAMEGEKSMVTDRPDTLNVDDYESGDENELSASTAFGLSARLPLSRQISSKVQHDTIKPILTPCCSLFCEESGEEESYKEFARFDFSHSNFYADEIPDQMEKGQRRKCSILMIPNATGSRVWTSATEKTTKAHHKMILCHVVSVSSRNKQLKIVMKIHNSTEDILLLKMDLHVHEGKHDKVGRMIKKTSDSIRLNPLEDTEKTITLKICDDVEGLFMEEFTYPIVTLNGNVKKIMS